MTNILSLVGFLFGNRSKQSAFSGSQIAAYAAFRVAFYKWLAEWKEFEAATVALGLPAPNPGLIYSNQLTDASAYGSGVVLFWPPATYGASIEPCTMDSLFRVHNQKPSDLLRAIANMALVSPAQFWDKLNLPKGNGD